MSTHAIAATYLLLQKLQTKRTINTYRITLNWFELVAFILSVNCYESYPAQHHQSKLDDTMFRWNARCKIFASNRDQTWIVRFFEFNSTWLRGHRVYPHLLSNGSSWVQYLIVCSEKIQSEYLSVHRFFSLIWKVKMTSLAVSFLLIVGVLCGSQDALADGDSHMIVWGNILIARPSMVYNKKPDKVAIRHSPQEAAVTYPEVSFKWFNQTRVHLCIYFKVSKIAIT